MSANSTINSQELAPLAQTTHPDPALPDALNVQVFPDISAGRLTELREAVEKLAQVSAPL